METKHTPGTWFRDGYGNIKANGKTLRVNGVSIPCGGRPSDFDEVEANSNLLAAAPELFKACAAIVEWFDKNPPAGGGLYCINQARAAIAKAEGR